MCKLLLLFSLISFCPISILGVDFGYTIKLSYGKYLDLIGQLSVRPKSYWTAKRRIEPENRRPTSMDKQGWTTKILKQFVIC